MIAGSCQFPVVKLRPVKTPQPAAPQRPAGPAMPANPGVQTARRPVARFPACASSGPGAGFDGSKSGGGGDISCVAGACFANLLSPNKLQIRNSKNQPHRTCPENPNPGSAGPGAKPPRWQGQIFFSPSLAPPSTPRIAGAKSRPPKRLPCLGTQVRTMGGAAGTRSVVPGYVRSSISPTPVGFWDKCPSGYVQKRPVAPLLTPFFPVDTSIHYVL
jgi:hypothetical protein